MKNVSLVLSILGIIATCLVAVPACLAQEENIYQSSEGHFSFTIPNGWVEFSKEQRAEILNAMNQLPGTKSELETGFFDKAQPSWYLLIQIKKHGRWSEGKIQKMISDGTFKQVTQDREKIFKDFGDVAFNGLVLDSNQHVLYMKAEIGSGESKAMSASAAILSSYGLAQIVVYSPQSDTDNATKYLKQIVHSFSFDNGYQYIAPDKNPSNIISLPKSVSGFVLLMMSILLYGKRFEWKKRKETKSYLIKAGVALIAAVISSKLVVFFQLISASRNLIDSIDVILAVAVGIFWYREHKKMKSLGSDITA